MQIFLADAKEYSKGLSDKSFDLIFTDPVYGNLDDYKWLGETAFRLLRNDRPLLVWGSRKKEHLYIPIIESFGFKHIYSLDYVVVAKSSRLVLYKLHTWVTPCMWFNKGKFQPNEWILDAEISYKQQPNGQHKWNKNPEVLQKWIRAFSFRDSQIFDPFMGSCSIGVACKTEGRFNYWGTDIDPKAYEMACERLKIPGSQRAISQDLF